MTFCFSFLFVEIDDAKMRYEEWLMNRHKAHGDGQFSLIGMSA
jgi:hypothetical protein